MACMIWPVSCDDLESLKMEKMSENVGKVGKMMIYHGNVEDLDEKLRTAP